MTERSNGAETAWLRIDPDGPRLHLRLIAGRREAATLLPIRRVRELTTVLEQAETAPPDRAAEAYARLFGLLGEVLNTPTARGILAGGAREIVLCGVRLGRYLGQDAGGRRVDFVEMLRRLLELPGDFRLRLSSLEVTDLTDRLLALAASSSGRLCPSFHVPLQSGSDEVLRRMGRWYTAAFYARRVEALRRQLPGASLFTAVMAGFPGNDAAKEALGTHVPKLNCKKCGLRPQGS